MKIENLKVLVVDDHMIMRSVVERHVNSLGVQNLTFAVNGREALDKAKQEVFDIIFADWNMPEMTGEELLKEIREDVNYNSSAFVMVTAEGEQSKILKIMNAGATSYLTKPFDEAGFKKTIQSVCLWLEKKRS